MSSRTDLIKSVVRVASGNFLEMYDFTIYGYYAASIGSTFFAGGATTSLLKSFVTFGVGFLMRPLGAIVLGAYLDRKGRRAGLLLTLALMSIGTLSIACIPGFRTIGIAAPILVVLGRLTQGFSAGVELGGVSVYLSEMAPPGHKGFYVSWQSASQQVAVILAAMLGVMLSKHYSTVQIDAWAWRIPVLFGCLIIPFLFLIRRSLPETEDFASRTHHPSISQIWQSVVQNWTTVVLGMLLVTMTTVSFYFITAYAATFGKTVLHLKRTDVFVVTLCVGLLNLVLLPTMGALSDRIGRRPLLLACALLMLGSAWPTLSWLTSAPSMSHLLAVELWFAALYASYNGAMVVYLTEIMPSAARTSGFSVAYSLATALFGGFTPAVCTWLVEKTGNKASPALWLTFAAICGLTATLITWRISTRVKTEHSIPRPVPL